MIDSSLLLQLPGFLELIVEFYRRCLIQIFGILEEYEVGSEGQRTLLGPFPNLLKEEVLKDLPAESNSQSQEEQRIARRTVEETKELLISAAANISTEEAKDSTTVVKEEPTEPRPPQASKHDKLPIKLEETGEEWQQVEARWAKLSRPNGFISGLLHWKAGGGDSTTHIQTHLEPRTGECAPPDLLEREGGDDGQEEGGEEQNQQGEEEEEGGGVK